MCVVNSHRLISSMVKRSSNSQNFLTLVLAINTVHVQGVVTYTLPVEAFATGIKMESSDQRSFLEPIKGSRRILSA